MEDKLIEHVVSWHDELTHPDVDDEPVHVEYLEGAVQLSQSWQCGDGCCSDTKRAYIDITDQRIEELRQYGKFTDEDIAELLVRTKGKAKPMWQR